MVDIINNKSNVINNKIDLLFSIAEVITGYDEESIKSKVRKRPRVTARSIISYMLHMELGLTVVQTGSIINRDHSTVVYYCKSHQDNFDWIKEYRDTYTQISETFWGNYIDAERHDTTLQINALERLIQRLKSKQEELIRLN
tara:strand:- start:3085 stop:3510 length:426 start_codon:yes stop_codon:yes gene_type:complete